MEILTEGNRHRADEIRSEPKIFFCRLCGCRYRAERTEYERGYSWYDNSFIFKATCPCCGEMVRLTEPV